MKRVTILIPTKNRQTALAATLTSLLAQTFCDFSIIISDQSTRYTIAHLPTFQTLQRIFHQKDIPLIFIKHLPEKGMAEQRQFLLEQSDSPYSLFLDDDCILESFVVDSLFKAIKKKSCGFVGQAVIGLSYVHDKRPLEQTILFWNNRVMPEKIRPNSKKWQRYVLHNAANIYHVQKKIGASPKRFKMYKIAWIGGCVLYNTKKLKDVGGFNFWKDLPKKHAGEDVVAQIRVMEKYGGCGIIPSGVYHQELPTTIPYRKVNAPEFFYDI